MAKIEIYGYEELNRMTASELLTVYNRIAERQNRRISRGKKAAGAGFQTSTTRLPVYRSASAKKKFTEKSHAEMVKEVASAERETSAVMTAAELGKARESIVNEIKVLVGQSYTSYHTDEAYHSKWMEKLTDEQLITLRDRFNALSADAMSDGEIWYMIKKATYAGNAIEPLRSYEDIIAALDRVEANPQPEYESKEAANKAVRKKIIEDIGGDI